MKIGTKLFVFAGRTGSGKTSISRIFAESNGLKWTSFGNIVRDEATRRGKSTSDKRLLQEIGQELVNHQPDRFCEMVLESLMTSSGVSGVLDGVRHKCILDRINFRTKADRACLIFIDVGSSKRHERLIQNRHWSLEQCKMYDDDPTEWELDLHLKGLADLIVMNDRSIASSLQQIDDWLVLQSGKK